MVLIHELPIDILIQIFQNVTISSVFSLRLTHPSFLETFSHHTNSIVPQVAKNTFPPGIALLKQPVLPGQYSFRWLKSLVPKYMAAVIVDRHRFGIYGRGIPAADIYGEVVRDRVTNGLRVLKRVANISKEAYAETSFDKDTSRRVLRSEYFICKRMNVYFHELDTQSISDYRLMSNLLWMAFLSRQEASRAGDFDICNMFRNRRFPLRGSFLDWFLSHEGPDLLWRQWCPQDQPSSRTLIRETLLEKYQRADERSINIVLQAACNHERLILSFPEPRHKDAPYRKASTSGVYWTQYKKIQEKRVDGGEEEPKETLNDVPYFTDLRVTPTGDVSVYGDESLLVLICSCVHW
jgi:hypothetical protein